MKIFASRIDGVTKDCITFYNEELYNFSSPKTLILEIEIERRNVWKCAMHIQF
jgi:hypothetical protein